MPVTTAVIALVLAAVVVEAIVRGLRRGASWGAFGGWVAAGFLSSLATVSFAIGLLVLPAAVAAIVAVSRVAVWPAALGYLSGMGALALLVAGLGTGGAGWLIAGVALAAAPGVAFAGGRRAA